MALDPLALAHQPVADAAARRFDRRDFLAYTSVGLLTPWVAPLAARAADRALELVAPPLPLSVGYITDSEGIPDLRRLNHFVRRPAQPQTESENEVSYAVVPADQLPLGDTSLIGHPLRIRLHGLYPPRVAASRYWPDLPQRFELDVLYPNPDPALSEPLRFHAWTFERLTTTWRNSETLALSFPLDWNALPAFELRTSSGGKTRALTTRFTLDTDAGLPRLRRGLYLLGFAPSAWTSSMSLRELGTAMPHDRFSFLVAFEQDPSGHL